MIVITPEDETEVGPALDHQLSRWDDAMWARILRLPFRWQTFLNWWVARRYVMPRDVRRQ